MKKKIIQDYLPREEKIKGWGKLTAFAGIIVVFLFLLSHILPQLPETGSLVYLVILAIFGIVFLIPFAFFVILIIIHQFHNKMHFWATGNILLSIISILGAYKEIGIFVVLGVLISCSIYYFIYIHPRLKMKKEKKKKTRKLNWFLMGVLVGCFFVIMVALILLFVIIERIISG